jgi:hypothetical protein
MHLLCPPPPGYVADMAQVTGSLRVSEGTGRAAFMTARFTEPSGAVHPEVTQAAGSEPPAGG